MTEYTNAIALALKLINKKGRTIILSRVSKADTGTPWKPGAPTNDNHIIKGVFLGTTSFNKEGELVSTDNEHILIAASGLAIRPTIADLIVDSAETLKILSVGDLKPGDEDVLYTLEVIRG